MRGEATCVPCLLTYLLALATRELFWINHCALYSNQSKQSKAGLRFVRFGSYLSVLFLCLTDDSEDTGLSGSDGGENPGENGSGLLQNQQCLESLEAQLSNPQNLVSLALHACCH